MIFPIAKLGKNSPLPHSNPQVLKNKLFNHHLQTIIEIKISRNFCTKRFSRLYFYEQDGIDLYYKNVMPIFFGSNNLGNG